MPAIGAPSHAHIRTIYTIRGRGMIAMCLVLACFGLFALYWAHIDMMVGELIYQTRHADYVIRRDSDPLVFWRGIAWRFLVGNGLIGTALAAPFQQQQS